MILKLFFPKEAHFRQPVKGTAKAACYDIHAFMDPDTKVIIDPGKVALIPTGIYSQLPPNWKVEIKPRSGLALKSTITVLNTPGTVDEDYRGEWGVVLINHGAFPFTVQNGDRIAQFNVAAVHDFDMEIVDTKEELTKTERGESGFGSTGVSTKKE